MHLKGLLLTVAALFASTANAQPTAPRARITEDLRLDANAEDFPRVRQAYVGPRGQIVVPLFEDRLLRIYDSTGSRRASLGRNGAGPGEFRDISSVGWKGDTMWVNDGAQRRMTYYAPNDSLLRVESNSRFDAGPQRRGSQPVPLSTMAPMGVLSNGDIIGFDHPRAVNSSPAQRAFGPPSHIVRVGSDRRQRPIADLPWGGDERWGMATGSGLGRPIPFAYKPQTLVSASADRIAHMWSELTSATGGTFTVTVLRTTGDTVFRKIFPFVSSRIPSEARDSAIYSLLPKPGISDGGGDAVTEFMQIARERIPSTYPGVENLILGLDETVWVGLRSTNEGQPHLVLNGQGVPIATVVIPKGSRLRQASARFAYATQTDSDGLTSVVRYRVSGISCGSAACR